ncbi:MAG TPA: helix-turn-helix domain-containing protein [bacterium]|nr:helix-turn-helix domain-containing protein [bacterium]
MPETTTFKLLDPREAAHTLAISPRNLWNLTQAGKIPCVKIGRLVRYSVRDLEEFANRLKTQGSADGQH